ncbi:MAG: succinate dehydrogenase assembly factor 4 [Rhodobiaceae bacterium]
MGADESTSQPAAPSSDAPAKMTPVEMTPAEMTPAEINGPKGPEPTRYGDWEQKGRCSDF